MRKYDASSKLSGYVILYPQHKIKCLVIFSITCSVDDKAVSYIDNQFPVSVESMYNCISESCFYIIV